MLLGPWLTDLTPLVLIVCLLLLLLLSCCWMTGIGVIQPI